MADDREQDHPDADRRRRTARLAALALAGLVALALVWPLRDVPADAIAYWSGRRPLAGVKSWHYQLDAVDVDAMSRLSADMLVTDYARAGGKVPLTADDVAHLKVRPDGSRRIVISYLSIGEAEEFRYYWNDAWKVEKPSWLVRENCAWPRAWMVRYWEPGWHEAIISGANSYLKRIVAAGFDGVYLDRVDMWENTRDLEPNSRAAMIDFVAELAATARGLKPGFIVIAQNAESLLATRRYRHVVDAVAKEELMYSSSETGKRNPSDDIEKSLRYLKQIRWQWKPVFPVEYLLQADEIAATAREERGLGLVPVFPTRALDGGDPTHPVALKDEIGTPEFIKAKCAPGTSW